MPQLFDDIADDYDELRPVETEVLNAIINGLGEHAKHTRYRSLLDIGCGTGRYSIPLAKKFNVEIIGIDISDRMINRAKRKWPSGQWIHSDINETLRSKIKSKVDIVLLAYVLQFLDWQKTLTYIEPILNKNGIIIMGLRVRVWVILYLFEHTRKDFQTEILLVP